MNAFLGLPTLCALGLSFLVPERASAQVEHRIRSAGISFQMQQTPRFAAIGPRDKPASYPHEWLEVEVAIQLETVHPTGFVDRMDIEYFVAVTDGTTGRTTLLSDRLTYLEVDASERRTFASAYVSPASLAKITGKSRPRRSDITAVAAVISAPGLRESVEVASGGPRDWWKAPGLKRVSGLILPKSRSPFAPFWWDRYPRDAEDLPTVSPVPLQVIPTVPAFPPVPEAPVEQVIPAVPVVPVAPLIPEEPGVPALPE
ncbi:MAG: Amuc_1102 family pilus-like protein [Akkermansiaceae bacterium]